MDYRSSASLKDRVAIITGAVGGIGLQASKALQEYGATVVMADLNTDRGEKAAQELGLEFFRADVTRSVEVCSLAPNMCATNTAGSTLLLTMQASPTRSLLKTAPTKNGSK
jgi:NAD(P)-dependent dehydrogenase (short-subunit alcohol dehydrogenase family)